MARDTELNIRINGDNRGFKKSLNQTQRDINQFEKSSGGGGTAAGIAGGLAGTAGLVGIRKLLLSNLASYTGIRKPGARPAAYGIQAGMGAALGNPHVGSWMVTHAKQMRTEKNKLREMRRRRAGALAGRDSVSTDATDLKSARASLQTIRQNRAFLSVGKLAQQVRMALPVLAPVMTVMAAAIGKKISNQNQLDASSKEFSGAVLAHEAKLEVSEIKRRIERSRDAGFIGSQKRSANASLALSRAGTSVTGPNVATEAMSVIKQLTAFGVNFSTSAEGFAGLMTGNPMLLNKAFYDAAKGIH